MMQTYRVFGLIIWGIILFQSCDLNKSKHSKTNFEKRIEMDTILNDKKFTFIDYEKAVSDLKSNMNFESVENKYDLVFILLLDSTEKQLIKSHRADLVEEFRKYSSGLHNEGTVGFYTEKSNIKEIFIDKKIHKRIIECVHIENSEDIKMETIDTLVYIKGNTAIFEISGPTWSNTYSAKLNNHIFQINWLGGYIE